MYSVCLRYVSQIVWYIVQEDLGTPNLGGQCNIYYCPSPPQLVLRINCLSTEFSSQKGVKGYPLHVVVDTHESLDSDAAEPAHRAYCKVKIFRDKVSLFWVGWFRPV